MLAVLCNECGAQLAIDVAASIRSKRVIEVLARLMRHHGAPAYLRSDSGPEFVSRAILLKRPPESPDTTSHLS